MISQMSTNSTLSFWQPIHQLPTELMPLKMVRKSIKLLIRMEAKSFQAHMARYKEIWVMKKGKISWISMESIQEIPAIPLQKIGLRETSSMTLTMNIRNKNMRGSLKGKATQ